MKGTSEAARLRLAAVAAEYVESLGRGLRFRREQLGLSRSEVARKLPGKTNENAIYRWEGGKHKPSDDTLEALADALDVGHWTRFMDLDPERAEAKPAKTPDLSSPAPTDALADRFDALQQQVTNQLAEHARKVEQLLHDQDALLRKQTELLEKLEAAIQRDTVQAQAVKDETDELRRLAREMIPGRPEAVPSNSQPTPQPPAAAKSPAATGQHTR